MTPYFEYRHVVGLEETNATGNVYFANHVRWQGRCREMFLHAHAPGILAELRNGLSLLTVSCSCDYSAELFALDHVSVRLFLEDQILNRLALRFEYWRLSSGPGELVARGSQQIACMRRGPNGMEIIAVPAELLQALIPFRRG